MRPNTVSGMPASTRRTSRGTWSTCVLAAILLPLVACHDHNNPAPPPAQVLEAPIVSSVTTADGTAEITWTAVDGANYYNFYWQWGESLDPATCDCEREMYRLQHRLTGLRNGNTYSFAVSASNQNGEGPLSEVRTRTLAPGIVVEISAIAGNGVVTIGWTGVEGATGYALYRGTTAGTARTTGTRMASVVSPYDDLTVVNGTTYYYCIAAIGFGGEGAGSSEVSAQPMFPPPDAPTLASVTLMEEAPNTLVIEWSAPTSGPADTYNLYWATNPNVTTAANQIEDVTSPHVHTGLAGKTTYYYVVTAVANGIEGATSAEVSATPRGSPGGGGGGGGGDVTAGNNLALPVLFTDGYGLGGDPLAGSGLPWLDYATGLRPFADDVVDPFPFFAPSTAVVLNGQQYFPQKSASCWQSEWQQAGPGTVPVIVDWGDNLSSAQLTANSNIRIETVLYQDTTGQEPAATMSGYAMTLLGGSGITELYGTDGTTYASYRWHVFAASARLTIEKLTGPGGPVDASVQGYTAALYENFGADEGGAKFGSEVNVSGKLVYGYIWMLKKWPLSAAQKAGWWRITFSLDDNAQIGGGNVPNRVFLTALDPSETQAILDAGHNRTSIEVNLQ
ncbi:MAG: fibronectin type III domain-containing protein [Planctomycetota bacterium]